MDHSLKVRCIDNTAPDSLYTHIRKYMPHWLTVGKVYDVVDHGLGWVEVVNDLGKVMDFSDHRFEVVE